MPTSAPPAANTYLSLLPIFLSAIAILVSLTTAAFTAYLQYFRKPKLDMFVSQWLRTWCGPDDELVLNAGITLSNIGAQYAVVTKMDGLLIDTSTQESIELEWSKFIVFENAAEKGKAFQPHGSFAGWADYLVIPNRQAVAHNIQFFSKRPFVGRSSRYRLKFTAHAGSGVKSKAVATAEVEFEINETKAEKLLSTRVNPETKISSGSVGFRSVHV
jgi:hypothetical protein